MSRAEKYTPGVKFNLIAYFQWSFLFFLCASIFQSEADIYRLFYFLGVVPGTIAIFSKGSFLKGNRTAWLLVMLLLLTYFSTFWSDMQGTTMSSYKMTRWFCLNLIFCGAAYIYGSLGLHKSIWHLRFIQLSIIAAIITILYPFVIENNELPLRLTGIGLLGHPILAPSVLIVLWATTLSVSERAGSDLILQITGLVLVIIFVYLTKSRGPLLAVLILTCFFLYGLVEKKKISILALIGLPVLLFLGYNHYETILLYFSERDSHRLEIWSVYLSNISEYFWTGIGGATPIEQTRLSAELISKVGSPHHPHNLFLSILLQAGIVGLMLLMAFIGSLLYSIFSLPKSDRFPSVLLLGAALSLCLTDTFRLISSVGEFWMFFWLPVCLLAGQSGARQAL